MEKLKRSERVAALIKILNDNPNEIFTLTYFSEVFNAAKSTISEDIAEVKKVIEKMSLGYIETISGAAGGVKFFPVIGQLRLQILIEELCTKLSNPERIIPGSFIYMSDIVFDPSIAARVGEVFATRFWNKNADYVVTIETKGITLALMTARALNIPLVVVRRDNRVTEGTTVSINYVSGSSKTLETMSISKRSLRAGSKVIFIDDFMKGGGTAKGVLELMKEFNVQVVGTGVLISTDEPKTKLVEDYYSLLNLKKIDEQARKILLVPANN